MSQHLYSYLLAALTAGILISPEARGQTNTDTSKISGTWRADQPAGTSSSHSPHLGSLFPEDIEFITFADSGRLLYGRVYGRATPSKNVTSDGHRVQSGTAAQEIRAVRGLFSRSRRPAYYRGHGYDGRWFFSDSAGIPTLCIELHGPWSRDTAVATGPSTEGSAIDGCRPYRIHRGKLEFLRRKWERLRETPAAWPRPEPKVVY